MARRSCGTCGFWLVTSGEGGCSSLASRNASEMLFHQTGDFIPSCRSMRCTACGSAGPCSIVTERSGKLGPFSLRSVSAREAA